MNLFNILAAVSASIAIYAQLNGHFLAFSLFKPLTTILIICVLLRSGKAQASRFSQVVMLALLACLVGDVLLLWEQLFVFGLGAFLVGHLLLTYAFSTLGGFRTKLLPLAGLAVVASAYYAYLYPTLNSLWLPVALYILVIVVMAWQATCLALTQPNRGTLFLCLASLLFMFSDSMIALNKFVWPFELSGLVVLSSYWLSIAIIANVTAYQYNDFSSLAKQKEE